MQVTQDNDDWCHGDILMLQLEKYKKHYLLLTQKGGLNMSEMSYDYLSAWCAKEMDTVFGKGWVVSIISHLSYIFMLSQGHSLHPDCALCSLHLHGQQVVARRCCVRWDCRDWLQEVLRGAEQGAGGPARQVREFIFSI